MIKIFLYLTIFLTYTLSMYVYAIKIVDERISAALWVFSLLLSLLLLYSYKKRAPISSELKRLSIYKLLKENYILIAIIILAILLRFWALDSIPILTHDEGKDTGLFPEMVLNGKLKDYFGFYQGMNNFFFVFSSIPHLFVDNSILKARLFSAFFGVLSVILIHHVIKRAYSEKEALISAFFLATYHVHLHFSRSEFLNIFDSFYGIVILAAIYYFHKFKSLKTNILLALTLGFGLHFYSGIRALTALTLLFYFLYTILKVPFKKNIIYLTSFIVFFTIAIGPMAIVYKNRPSEALAKGNTEIVFYKTKDLKTIVGDISNNYIKSLSAYISEPIEHHYKYGGPFLVFPFSALFVVGLIVCILKMSKSLNGFMLLTLFGIPFFNSAILYNLNNAHRLMTVVPFISIIMSLGTYYIVSKIKYLSHIASWIFILTTLSAFFIYNINIYFYKNVWENALFINEFRAWEAQKLVNREDVKTTLILFVGNSLMPSYKSIPSLEYLTKKYTVIDILNPEMLYQIINYRNFVNYLFIILPDNNIIPSKQTLAKYFYSNKAYFKKVYYKNMYLFDILKITKTSEY